MSQICPFCFSAQHSSSYLPDTFFNKKRFEYIKCKKCSLIYLNPFPTAEDFTIIYPPSYQSGINNTIVPDQYRKIQGIRFSYGKQFDLIRKLSSGKKILDYGCGHANFLINARHNGFDCDGVEYNPDHVTILKKEIPNSNFYLIDAFLKDQTLHYDVIRLSNVLEHLTNPREITEKLVSKLNPNGILLIEGPIETNHTFALRIRQIYFNLSKLLRKNWVASHPPTHIFFANSTNQRNFFKNFPLQELHYELAESEWPFPEKWEEVKGIGSAFKFVIAKFSISIKPLSKNWGNTFIYIGRKA
jgi:2-polyprenyl-3-methyl-5-hydroxy-6-metoxy-1,4-benzoquinol methylase